MAWLNRLGRAGTGTAGAVGWLLAGIGVMGGVAAGCSDDGADGSGGGSPSPTTGAGGSPAGGTGGVPVTSSTTAGGSGNGGEAPIQCAPTNEYSNITPGDCDLLQQNCPPGQTCRPVAAGTTFTTACQPAPGLKVHGADCNNNSECQAGLFCSVGKCSPVCCNGSVDDVPCMGGSCNLSLSYGGTPEQHIWLCTFAATCVPLTADACPPGEGCHIEEPGVASCFPPSGANAMEGEDCQFLNDCPDMQHCHEGFCRWMCDLQGSTEPPGLGSCPVDQSCNQFQFAAIPHLGICEPL